MGDDNLSKPAETIIDDQLHDPKIRAIVQKHLADLNKAGVTSVTINQINEDHYGASGVDGKNASIRIKPNGVTHSEPNKAMLDIKRDLETAGMKGFEEAGIYRMPNSAIYLRQDTVALSK